MKMRRTAVTLAALGTAAAVTAPAAMASTGSTELGTKSLATVLTSDGNQFDTNWYDYDIVTEAALAVLGQKPSSAVGVLTDGNKPVTAFIPDDRSFQVLAKELTGKWYGTEKGVFGALAAFDLKDNGKLDTIETVLLYHVLPGATITKKDAVNADGAKLTMANGGTVTVDVVSKWLPLVVLKDADKNDVNPFVNPRRFDINKGNKQIAHGIVFVLRPADLP
ncbi:MAG TPA: fasciclin domain-containing protein [Dermatophilaceae bacterium]|nr:fasciclin domain-containing protein [Dermatophilaceae bacterium]